MHVFISWHESKSLAYAEKLKDLIKNCIQSTTVFCSSDDIHNGDNWPQVLFEELSSAKYGIVCLTKDNIKEPWINFEAGAIANKLGNKMTCLLIDLKTSDLFPPLSLYQATKLEKKSIQNMLLSINETLPNKVETSRILDSFNMFYSVFEENIQKLNFPTSLSSENSVKNLKQILDICQENNLFLRKMDSIMPSIVETVDVATKTDFQKSYNILYDKVAVFLFRLSQLDESLYENTSTRFIFKLIIAWAEETFKYDKELKKIAKQHLEKIKLKYDKFHIVNTKHK